MDVRNSYMKLYKHLMKYTWNLSMIKSIADLEVSSYTSCVDVDDIQHNLDKVRYGAQDVLDDEELSEAFDRFYDILDSQDTTFVNLPVIKEVVQQ